MKKMRALGDWLNELRDYFEALRPLESDGTATSRHSVGVMRNAPSEIVQEILELS